MLRSREMDWDKMLLARDFIDLRVVLADKLVQEILGDFLATVIPEGRTNLVEIGELLNACFKLANAGY